VAIDDGDPAARSARLVINGGLKLGRDESGISSWFEASDKVPRTRTPSFGSNPFAVFIFGVLGYDPA
jgi:hypothetical protein